MPRLAWNASKRRVPRNASRRTRSVQRSPITESVRAIVQSSLPTSLQRTRPYSSKMELDASGGDRASPGVRFGRLAARAREDAVELRERVLGEPELERAEARVELLRHQTQEVARRRRGARLRDLPAGEVAAPDVEHLPLLDEHLHRLPQLVPRRVPVDVVHLVEVDVVGAQAAQAALARLADVIGGEAPVVRTRAHPPVDLGREDDPLAPATALREPAADDLLGDALARAPAARAWHGGTARMRAPRSWSRARRPRAASRPPPRPPGRRRARGAPARRRRGRGWRRPAHVAAGRPRARATSSHARGRGLPSRRTPRPASPA